MKEIHATEDNLIRQAMSLHISKIRLHHLKISMLELESCDLITIEKDGLKKTLKDRFHYFGDGEQ